ncbi:MAG: SMI1/KNR4 family protein [Lachnospiraceae bacterium]|nr:SMI1/KNR4 family protein [Lachnospiraceae bacterium]
MGIVEVFEAKEEVIAGRGVSIEMIVEAERELNVSFSEDYREYLRKYGLVMCCGHELTGLGKSERANVVYVTKQMKKIKQGIPEDWYVLENENMDGAIIWQDTKGNVYFNTRKIFSSLVEFVQDL